MKVSVPLKENHKALWNWLAKNPDKTKGEWPGWTTLIGIRKHNKNKRETDAAIEALCFACAPNNQNCFSCPCDWGVSKQQYSCLNYGSIFKKWSRTLVGDKANIDLAHQIAELWK